MSFTPSVSPKVVREPVDGPRDGLAGTIYMGPGVDGVLVVVDRSLVRFESFRRFNIDSFRRCCKCLEMDERARRECHLMISRAAEPGLKRDLGRLRRGSFGWKASPAVPMDADGPKRRRR